MKIDSTAFIGFARAIGVVVLMAVLSFIGDATHLTWLNNSALEAVIAAIALALEHKVQEKNGKALFGAIKA